MKVVFAVLVGAAAVLSFLALASGASAQYGKPPGINVCSTSSTTVDANGNATITVKLTDSNGAPIVGAPVVFETVPGGAATPAVGVTGADGTATAVVKVGNGPAVLEVNTLGNTGSGQLTCRLVLQVKAPPPPATATSPTGAVAGQLQAPKTGDAGLLASDSTMPYLAIAMIAVLLTTLSGAVVVRARKG
ncbi:MAG TPA: Ig-like domain-containing protein [Dehalococcoidia bacterium]|nr:Ig-like domain-containing protein [Dehalococcoidia bacterium]